MPSRQVESGSLLILGRCSSHTRLPRDPLNVTAAIHCFVGILFYSDGYNTVNTRAEGATTVCKVRSFSILSTRYFPPANGSFVREKLCGAAAIKTRFFSNAWEVKSLGSYGSDSPANSSDSKRTRIHCFASCATLL